MNINKGNCLYLSSIIVIYIFFNYNSYHISAEIDFKNANLLNVNNPNWILYSLFDFVPTFEYVIEIDSKELFPDQNIMNEVLESNKQIEYTIPSLQYELLGYKITATNVNVITESFHHDNGDRNQLRINFPVMNAENVNVKDRMIDMSFAHIDFSSTYIIYDSVKGVFSIHIPLHIALRYLP